MTDPPAKDLRAELEALEKQLLELRRRVDGGNAPAALEPRRDVMFAELLVCRVGERRVAFPLNVVREIVPIVRLTPLPETPAWVKGVLNLRGMSLPVLDLTSRLEGTENEAALSDLIVVCHSEGRWVGLLVPEVFDVVSLESETLDAASGDIPHAPYLLGVVTVEDIQTLVFSVPRLLDLSGVSAADVV